METKSFVMFSTKTKTYAEDIDLGDGKIIKAGTPVDICWVSFSVDGGDELVASFHTDDEMLALMDSVQVVKRVSKTSGKARLETRFPVKVVYSDTEDPEVKEVVSLTELPPPSLKVCAKSAARIRSLLA